MLENNLQVESQIAVILSNSIVVLLVTSGHCIYLSISIGQE